MFTTTWKKEDAWNIQWTENDEQIAQHNIIFIRILNISKGFLFKNLGITHGASSLIHVRVLNILLKWKNN